MNANNTDENIDFLTVNLGERGYDIIIGDNLLCAAGEQIKDLTTATKIFIVSDENVAKYHLPTLETALAGVGLEYEAIILKAGEQSKTFAVLESLLNTILKQKPERNSMLIALGGGVIGDITGFAASILLRGVPFVQIPTTLLAQVDSSVGGKTGINTQYGKNLVGSFYQPRLVMADISLLQTLPKREYLAGYAEVVKYGLINNPAFFEYLETNENRIITQDHDAIRRCIRTSCETKAKIVSEDEKEGGVRALLNLGHTFGHALEVETGYSDVLLHGEAVAIGMVLAFGLSVRLGLCLQADYDRVVGHFKAIGLPTSPKDIRPKWDIDRLVSAMYQDKKVEKGKLVFILAKGIGKSFIAKDIAETDVKAFLKEGL